MKLVEALLRNSLINHAIDSNNQKLLHALSNLNYPVVGKGTNVDLIKNEEVRNLDPRKTPQNKKDKCCEWCGTNEKPVGPLSNQDPTVICSDCWNKVKKKLKNSLQTPL